MKKRTLLVTAATLTSISPLLGAGGENAADSRSAKPNIIFILTDDLGYGDLGCYGGEMVPTPNIDRLAREGVRFIEAYATAPICAPSRAGLITGAYNQRFGCQANEDEWPDRQYVIPEDHLIMPEALGKAGYVTGAIGKWNVARDVHAVVDQPIDIIGFEADYFPDASGHYQGVNEPVRRNSSKIQGVIGPDPERPDDEYLTDRLGRRAVEFIDRNRAEPFFLYLSLNAPHSPFQAPRDLMEKFGDIRPEPLNYYAAMVASIDENVGRILGKLEELGLAENTLILFTSDHGPSSQLRVGWREEWPERMIVGSAGELRGHKGQYFEGGIRVPFLLRWPQGAVGENVEFDRPVSLMDIYPTFVAAAGGVIPPATDLDGVDLLPYLRGQQSGDPHEVLFWKNEDRGAIRRGDWKLVLERPRAQLFNIAKDPGEQNDRIQQESQIAGDLRAEWDRWSDSLPPRSATLRREAAQGRSN